MTKIDHIGIAVNSIEQAAPLYAALLGQNITGSEEVPGEKARVVFFGHGSGRIELLEPSERDSALGRFLARHGPGLHHVCLAVADVEAALERAVELGAEPVPPAIRRGAAGRRVAFLHPRSCAGVLIELTETSP